MTMLDRFLKQLESRRLSVELQGEEVVLVGRDQSPAIVAAFAKFKPDLMRMLSGQPATMEECRHCASLVNVRLMSDPVTWSVCCRNLHCPHRPSTE